MPDPVRHADGRVVVTCRHRFGLHFPRAIASKTHHRTRPELTLRLRFATDSVPAAPEIRIAVDPRSQSPLRQLQHARAMPAGRTGSRGAESARCARHESHRASRKGDALYRAGRIPLHALCTRFASARARPPCSPRTDASRSPVTTCSATSSASTASPADHHGCDAVALEDTEVCVLALRSTRGTGASSRCRCSTICTSSCRARSRATRTSCCCSAACAPKSASRCSCSILSDRYRGRGYSATEFVLRMTREEIGSYLGLKLETVSRSPVAPAGRGAAPGPGPNGQAARLAGAADSLQVAIADSLKQPAVSPASRLSSRLGQPTGLSDARQRTAVHFVRRASEQHRQRR